MTSTRPQAAPERGSAVAGAPAGVDKAPQRIAGMFDAIAGRYDTLNLVLSAGLDRRWRRRAVRALALTGRERVLDLCTGTADLAIAAVRAGGRGAADVVGIDFAGEMLRIGAAKVRRAALTDRIRLARGDATRLPLGDGVVDAVMIAFGIRNVIDPERACRECHRVLRQGGRLAILEFGLPRVPGVRALYRAYFTHLLPLVGRLVSRHREAYTYLPDSVQQFPAGEAFIPVLRRAGFSRVSAVSLSLGIVYLYVADK
jgi:demethylmenaquinone methyltransferase/2-methoxy-6-polyprenyl-1,4-benzoquinol methylase